MKPQKPIPHTTPTSLPGICQTHCPTRWCCSVQYFVPVPLDLEKIQEIENFCKKTDFYKKSGTDLTLKTRKNQYCVFFDDQQKTCGIYPVRPFDCRLYPFDFHAQGTAGRWLLWDCAYARQLDEAAIEQILTDFETFQAHEFFRIWDYANDTIDLDQPIGFRLLRKMKISPANTVPPR